MLGSRLGEFASAPVIVSLTSCWTALEDTLSPLWEANLRNLSSLRISSDICDCHFSIISEKCFRLCFISSVYFSILPNCWMASFATCSSASLIFWMNLSFLRRQEWCLESECDKMRRREIIWRGVYKW